MSDLQVVLLAVWYHTLNCDSYAVRHAERYTNDTYDKVQHATAV